MLVHVHASLPYAVAMRSLPAICIPFINICRYISKAKEAHKQ